MVVVDDRRLAVEMGALGGAGLGAEAIHAELGEVEHHRSPCELRDPDIWSLQLSLHDFRVELAKPARRFPFYLDGIGAGQIKV
jgi:hypothetical protein